MYDLTTEKRKIVAVCSATGGLGRTSITVNLATYLAMQGMKVSLIDADLQFGDLAMALNLEPERTIHDAAENQATDLAEFCMTHMTGIKLLAAPKRPEFADVVPKGYVKVAAEELGKLSDVVLIETQAGFTEKSLEILEIADLILVVVTPDMTTLKNTRLMVETLEALELKSKTRLIVNKANLRSVVKIKEIPNLTQMEVLCELPFELKLLSRSLDIGVPIVRSQPKLEYSLAVEAMAKRLFVIDLARSSKGRTKKKLFGKAKSV